jgi:hypothetical protein
MKMGWTFPLTPLAGRGKASQWRARVRGRTTTHVFFSYKNAKGITSKAIILFDITNDQ